MSRPQKSPTVAHITRKRGVYYYRRRLPAPLRGEVGFSLRTKAFRYAEYLATCLDSELNKTFHETVSEEEVATILRGYLGSLLADYREAHWQTPRSRSLFGVRIPDNADSLDHDLEFIQDEIAHQREAIGRRDTSLVIGAVDELMKAHGVPEAHRFAMTEGVLAANIRALKTMRLRLLGQLDSVALASAPLPALGVPVTSVIGPRLSTLLPAFELAMTTGEEPAWNDHTAGQNKNTVARFLEISGDRSPAMYALADITRFLSTMEKLPSSYGKAKGDKERKVEELIARADGQSAKRLSRGTIERHKATISKLFDYLRQNGHRNDNPVEGHKFLTSEEARERRPWSSEQLSKFFSSPFYTGAASENRRASPGSLVFWDHFYWLPLLGLYQGNRLEEFAQLRQEDIRVQDGIDFIRITDEDGRQVKNKPSIRRVPIHPEILRLGFLDYVAEVSKSGSDRLFPGLTPGGRGKKFGHYFSRRFGDYRKQLGVYEELRDYHSFRHGVETKLGRLPNVQDRFIDILLGHQGTGTGRKVYLDREDIPIAVLAQIMSQVNFPEVQVFRPESPIVLWQKSETPPT